MRTVLGPLAAVLLLISATALAQDGYYRQPDLHNDTVVFVSEGDLWRVPLEGGKARRLTTHPAEESQPAISPDGRRVAFVASYEGAPDVYIMPLGGGEPQRLSFDGSQVWLAGFSPDGRVVYATEHVIGPGFGRMLRAVDPDTLETEDIPLADARQAAFDDDGNTLWFTRFGLAVSADHMRDYRGGAMAQLWRWDTAGSAEAERLARDHNANITHPMWWNSRIYAISDADGSPNLWALDEDGQNPVQLTSHRDFEVREARLNNGRIIYRMGADIHVYDLALEQDRKLDISLDSDFLQRRERWLDTPLQWVTAANPDAEGKRAALTVRGQAWLAGTHELRRIRLAVPEDARARAAVSSVDGKQVFAIVDHDGKSEIWRFAADGSGDSKRLVEDEQTHRWQLWPSPDGRWLAHSDKNDQLWLLDLESGKNRLVDEARYGSGNSYGDLTWSADGRWLAWSRPDTSRSMDQLVVAAAGGDELQVVTSDRYESYSPAFSRDGQWLYFLSDRHFSPTPGSPWGDRNTGALFDKRTKIHALALQPGLRFPFDPDDELSADNDDTDSNSNNDKDDLPGIVFDGLAGRLHEVPLSAGNYSRLQAHKDRLYFMSYAAGQFRGNLMTLVIKTGEAKAETFMKNVLDARLTLNGERLLVATPGRNSRIGKIMLLPATDKAPSDTGDNELALSGWSVRVDPVREWQQMFSDAWSMHRYFSFDANMRGVDWHAVREHYEPLVARVNDRLELDDLLGQMTAELGILHSQVRGGDYRDDGNTPGPASLGARLTAGDDGVLIEHIYRTDPELPGERGPLQQPGMDIANGDVIRTINGVPVKSLADVARQLRGQAGQQVLLDISREKTDQRVVVKPAAPMRDTRLRYSDWLQDKSDAVQEAGDGRIGYLHLYSMVSPDFAGFVRDFYAQYDRDALIIDVRRNRGGNIDSWVIEKLLRRAWAFWQPPHGAPYTNMQQAFRGHLVVLADNFTYSDGETFTAGVKSLGLGPVIGQRTAGAGIWLSDQNRLRDGGLARVAETGQFDMDGNWIIEGLGVGPDIPVENKPWATARGHDAQLEAALDYLADKLEQEPIPELKAKPVAPAGQPAADVRPLEGER